MGDQQRGAPLQQAAQGGVDLLLDAGVDRRGGVIEDEDVGIGEEGACESHPLALAARKGEAPLADDGVVAAGEGEDELVRFRGLGGGDHVVEGGVGDAESDVVPDRVGEEEALLEDHADLAAQGVEGDVAHVGVVDAYLPGLHVVEAGQQ